MTAPSRGALAALLALALGGCAQPGALPGGPPDALPPRLVRISPDSGAVDQRPGGVVFRFDEVVSERPASSGARQLADLVLVSPTHGAPSVRWRRDAIEVERRGRWRDNTTYTITVAPGLVDLRGNVRREPIVTIFSTGASIPATRVEGVAFDWFAGTALQTGVVQGIVMPDSVTYVTNVDSTGRWSMEHLPAGPVWVRVFDDRNRNRGLDVGEAWDSVTVTLADTSRAELFAFVRDTIGPRIESVVVADSVTLRVQFDKPLAPAPLDSSAFALLRPDSSRVPLGAARPDTAGQDSTRQAAITRDSTAAARRDSLRRRELARDSIRRAGGDTTVRPLPDSLRPRPLPARPTRRSPFRSVLVTVQRPLTAGDTLRLRAVGARNVIGAAATSDFLLTVPAPPPAPPPDSLRPPAADSLRRAPAGAGRPPAARADTTRATPRPVRPDTARGTPPPASPPAAVRRPRR